MIHEEFLCYTAGVYLISMLRFVYAQARELGGISDGAAARKFRQQEAQSRWIGNAVIDMAISWKVDGHKYQPGEEAKIKS